MRAGRFWQAGILAILWLTGATAQPAPSPEEQAAWVAATREQALRYTQSLPDFLCTEVTRRYSTPDPAAPETSWKLLDTLTVRLSYFDRKEAYRVIRINDKPVNKDLSSAGGWSTRGDFGSMLRGIFEPESQARFTWERWDTWKNRRVAVFSYRLDREHGGFRSTAHSFLKTVRAVWGATGLIYVDAESRRVLRLSIDSVDMPAESPTREVHIILGYDFQKIGDREFLLPSDSLTVTIVKAGKLAEKSDSRFTDYRKFSTDSRIEFGTGEGK